MPRGLADSSKVTQQISEASKYDHRDVRVETAGNNTKKYFVDTHKVQILDPATGTGTFPLAVIKHIEKSFANMKGMWPQYVAQDLIPRLHGFEIMMSSYSMAHLKLAMYLRESGVTLTDNQRLDIYLTNSLEEGKEDTHNLFSAWLSNEAKEANYIKNQTPIMVVIGNPPYSVSSSNSGQWIKNLIQDYKKDLNERNIQPLSDDYIKFIRYAQNYVDKNGSGIVAYISNNSFLDGIIHRQMRKSLLETFDDIYILDLHGNSKKKEVSPDGTSDNNVFDIMQGVSINIFVKHLKEKISQLKNENQNTERKDSPREGSNSVEFGGVPLAKVHHADLYGKRQAKYDYLDAQSLSTVSWQKLDYTAPNYFFVPKDFSLQSEYEKGIKLDELFSVKTSGVKTHHDAELVSFKKFHTEFNQKYDYRPFDTRFINYDLKKVERHRYSVMKNLINIPNISLIVSKQQSTFDFSHVLLSRNINDMCLPSSQTKEGSFCFPLYLYTENK